MPPRQGINNNVLITLFMSNGEHESLHKFNPFSMPGIELELTIEELESLVIRMHDKCLGLYVMTPMVQYRDDGIEFFIICSKLSFSPLSFLLK